MPTPISPPGLGARPVHKEEQKVQEKLQVPQKGWGSRPHALGTLLMPSQDRADSMRGCREVRGIRVGDGGG